MPGTHSMSQAYLFMDNRFINRKYNELYQIFKLSYASEEHKVLFDLCSTSLFIQNNLFHTLFQKFIEIDNPHIL